MNNLLSKYSASELSNTNIPNISFLHQFLNIKDLQTDMKYWDKCADVLIRRGHEKIKSVELIMLIWLEDLNWPGSFKVLNYFLTLDITELNDLIIEAFTLAYYKKDIEWAINLCNLINNKENGIIIFDNIRKYSDLSNFLEEVYSSLNN